MKKMVDGNLIDLTGDELAEYNAMVSAAEADRAANGYKIERETAYPSISEQLDMQYWDAVNGTTTWRDAIAKVKADHPKP